MIPAAFAIPGDINLPTGGYTYDRRVLALLPQFGIEARHIELPGSFPDPSAADLADTGRLLGAVGGAAAIVIDGLAYGAMPPEVIARVPAPIVALVHHPLCLEAGLLKARQNELFALEKAALARAGRIVATSEITARTLAADFAVPRSSITVAEPGTDPAPRAHGTGRPLQLLAVGAVVPRKAYDTLVRALAPLRDRDWRLAIAGPTDRSPEALAALNRALRETGLGERIAILGAVDQARLAQLYAAADAFLMPSLYEGYGMVLGEAMARGLPIVCTTGGAAAETAPDAAAIKVAPGDEAALTGAIRRLLDDPRLASTHGRCLLGGRAEPAALGGDGATHCWGHQGACLGGASPMSGFSPEWLDLREPVDHRSRNRKVERALAKHFDGWRPITVVDLGCGTGSNLRATAPLLGPEQHWTLVDNDQALLEAAAERLCTWADGADRQQSKLVLFKGAKRIAVEFRRADLAGDLEAALGPSVNLVTASALFDLASVEFIARFAAAVAARKSAFYTVLTYDGDQRWTPEHEADPILLEAFHAHQKRDKGFGPSAGPDAADALSEAFSKLGYAVSEGDSAWRLGGDDEALIAELASGFAVAAGQTAQTDWPTIAAWRTVTRTQAVVGHTDTLALPPAH